MPTYDYRCEACGHEFELFQYISEPVKRKCPECGRLRLRRLIGPGGGLVFRGSGFYITDYRSEQYKKAAAAEKKAAEGNGSSSSGKSSESSKSSSASHD